MSRFRRVADTRSESGMTLIELLISAVVITLISGALGAAFVTAYRNVNPMNQRIRESNDAQRIAAFLVRDAQSAGADDPSTGTLAAGVGVSSPGTVSDCTGPTGTVVLRFVWRDYLSTTTWHTHVANYFYDSAQKLFVRKTCVDGATESQFSLGTAVLTVDDGGSPATNNVAACIAADSSESPCPSTPSSTLPDRVRLHFTETNNPQNSPQAYQFTLVASLRPLTGSAPNSGTATTVPLLTLGGCDPNNPSVDTQGSPDVVVYGSVQINNSCDPIDIATAATFVTTGGINSTTPFADPFANLAPPTYDCTTSSHGVNGPGTYVNAASFSNVTLAPGIYILCNGAKLTGNVTANGVMFYVVAGIFDGSNSNLVMSAPTSGPYGTSGADIVVWQAKTDTSDMALCCSNTASATLDGTIYAPTATVQLKNADMVIKQVIAYAVVFGPGGGTHSTVLGTQPATPISLTTTTLPAWTVNRPYPANTKLVATGGSGGYTYSATNLPPGLALDPLTGVISGTPTTASSYDVTATATDSIGEQDIKHITILINSPPTITTPSLPNWTVNRTYSTTVTAANGTPDPVTGYAWSATGMPPGLSINSNGVVSGTPTTPGPYNNVVVTVADMAGATATRTYSITINAAPSITGPATLPDWTVGQVYPPQAMTEANGTPPFTWTVSGLPDGLTLDPNTGAITGTPTIAKAYTVTVTLHDNAGATDTKQYNVTINAAPGIQTGSLPVGEQNVPYNFQLQQTNGTPPFTWSASPALPPGLTLDPNTGIISGTPTAPFNANVTFTLKDKTNAKQTTTLLFVVTAPVSITGPPSLQPWTVNQTYPDAQMTAANGVAPYTWSQTGLPPGMSINALGNGVISGTPTLAGSYPVTITVTDSLGGTTSTNFVLKINALPTISTASLPDGELTVAYNATVVASGGTPGYTWAASGVPDGLSIDSTGKISGTPTQAGPFSITVTATDSAGAAVSKTFNITVAQAPSNMAPATLPGGTAGTPYSVAISFSGGTGPFTWSATGLPSALSIDSSGTISGTPAASGTYPVTVTVVDSLNASVSQTYSLVISDAPTITTSSLPSSTVSQPYNFAMVGAGGTAPLIWSATGLPSGVTIGATTGAISGTPTVSAPYSATIKLKDSAGASTSVTLSLTINDPPSITTATLPDATQSVAYSASVTGSAGTTPYTFGATGLPTGLTMSSDGTISGTPTATGPFSVDVTLTDASGATATATLALQVAP